ncbi:MAG: divalent cation tolerance protein CutA [Nitrospirales bacterium]|nr:divalent cation tolerance protein CutA [Nitrospirales bacterium]
MAEIVVLVTVGSEEEGTILGKLLVERNLVACVNILPRIRSIFKWEGCVSIEQECLLILKSTSEVFTALEILIKAHHCYDVPEIIALPIIAGSADYLSWVRSITHDANME